MLATPEPRNSATDSNADLEAARAEVRATLRRVRQKAKTEKNADSKLLRLRTKLAQKAFTEEDLEAPDPAADTLPPTYNLGPLVEDEA